MEKICCKPSSSSSEQSRWSDLPLEILTLIAEKLSPTSDYLIFGSVCRSWRSAAGKSNYPPFRQKPWLMLLENNPKSGMCRFFNLAEKTVYNLELPELRNTRFVGSTGGWLVIVTKDLQVRILNPMSRRLVSLPPLSGLRAFDGHEGRFYWSTASQKFLTLINKVCLSRGAPRACAAMAIYGHFKLAIAWPGDDSWTDVDSDLWPFIDVIHFNGAFHAVNADGCVVSCNDNISGGRSIDVRKVANPVSDRFYGWNKYLVDSSGDLLQVLRLIECETREYNTIRFQVFRWKPEVEEWVEVRNLVDRAIFLGCNSALSVSVSGSSCRPNCIYFADHAPCTKVYNLEEETIVRSHTFLMKYPPILIQPTLWPFNTQGNNN